MTHIVFLGRWRRDDLGNIRTPLAQESRQKAHLNFKVARRSAEAQPSLELSARFNPRGEKRGNRDRFVWRAPPANSYGGQPPCNAAVMHRNVVTVCNSILRDMHDVRGPGGVLSTLVEPFIQAPFHAS